MCIINEKGRKLFRGRILYIKKMRDILVII